MNSPHRIRGKKTYITIDGEQVGWWLRQGNIRLDADTQGGFAIAIRIPRPVLVPPGTPPGENEATLIRELRGLIADIAAILPGVDP